MRALDLLQKLDANGTIKHTRIKDIKTALKKLSDACHIPLETLDLSPIQATYTDTLKTYFDQLATPASGATIRNTFQNLGQLYKDAAATAGWLRPLSREKRVRVPSMKSMKMDFRAASPYKHIHAGKAWTRYALPQKDWPPDLQRGWRDHSSMRALQLRKITMKHYRDTLAQYLGYNHAHEQPPITQWDQLFELSRIRNCIYWMAERVGADGISQQGWALIILMVDMAKHQERPDYATLQKFKRSLPKAAKVYDKKMPIHTVSLPELEEVGLLLMDEARHVRKPYEVTGEHRAARFASGFLIRFLVRCPRRSKEIREMDLGGRLYQDERGIWQIYYRPHQLKISEHLGHAHEFRMEWPEDLADDLEEYLREYRPHLLHGKSSQFVFPNHHGGQLCSTALRDRIVGPCFEKLGKHVYPHLFRTLWCDAYLDAHPGDYEGAAAMLNDTPQTVEGWYRQFRVEQHLKKAVHFNAQLFGNGHRNGRK